MLPFVLLLAAAPPSVATIDADARCVATFAYIVGTSAEDEKAKNGAALGTLYFVGKLKGVDPNISIEAAIRRAVPKMPDIKSDLSRCLEELGAVGSELGAAGAALKSTP